MHKTRSTGKVMLFVSLIAALLGMFAHGQQTAFSQTGGTTIFLPFVTGPADQPEIIAEEIPLEEQEAAREFWTRERMMQAQPAALPEVQVADDEQAGLADEPLPTEPAGSGESAEPDPELVALAQQIYAEEWAADPAADLSEDALSTEPGASLAAASYRAYYVASYYNIRSYPYSAMGRLFFRDKNGNQAFCSGAVIARRAILTAGHCLYDAGRWNTNFVFVPAYHDGMRPFGSFTGRRLYAFTAWQQLGSRAYGYDMAILSVNDNKVGSTAYPISSWTGTLGMKWNDTAYASRYYYTYGYPTNNHPSQGRWLMASNVQGTFRTERDSKGALSIGIYSGHTPGSSGGPWLIAISGKNYVVGVNSHYRTNDGIPDMFSPYFDSKASTLYTWAAQQ